MRLVDAETLYKKAADLESLAMETLKVQEDTTEFQRWQTILGERTAFKHDVFDAPTIDAVPVKHGEWVVSRTEYSWNGAEYPTHCKCDQCGREVPYQDRDNYCPNCGAKMYGGTDNG